MNRKTSLLYVSAITLATLWFGCTGQSGSPDINEGKLIPAVEAVQSRFGALPLTLRLSGVVRAKNQIALFPEVNAVIEAVLVQNGEEVNAGQPLVRLRDKEFQERLKQSRASLQIAVAQERQADARLKEIHAELKRTETLSSQELVSNAELEAIQTRAISAEADLELANARVDQAQATVEERIVTLSQTIIRAPVTGSVGNRNAEVGMLVSPSTRLFTLGQLDNVQVEVVLTDQMLTFIEKGQRSEIYVQHSPNGSINASMSRISPFLHPVTHSTEAEIDVANPEGFLKSGMFVPVDIYYGESEQATLVPLSALYENPATGETGVYVTQENLNREPVASGEWTGGQPIPLTDPVYFEFVSVDIIAKGRMEAGIRGIDSGKWVVSLGQNLLGGEAGEARVRPVKWGWVNKLQNLQRQDLMEDVRKRQQTVEPDTFNTKPAAQGAP